MVMWPSTLSLYLSELYYTVVYVLQIEPRKLNLYRMKIYEIILLIDFKSLFPSLFSTWSSWKSVIKPEWRLGRPWRSQDGSKAFKEVDAPRKPDQRLR